MRNFRAKKRKAGDDAAVRGQTVEPEEEKARVFGKKQDVLKKADNARVWGYKEEG